jgi:hypothetical protein
MMNKEKEPKKLTELQSAFLTHLFGEAKGDPNKAKRLAGYSDGMALKDIVEPLQEEINKLTISYLAAHGPKVAITSLRFLDDEDQPKGGSNTLKAIQMIKEMIGLGVQKSDSVDLKVPSGGLFILPAKEVPNFQRVEKESDDA